MALKKNIEYPWLAWIPIIKLFILGEIIGEKVTISSLKIPYAQVILPVASICSGALIAIPFFGWIIGIAIAVYNYAAYYRLYKLYYSDSAVLFLVPVSYTHLDVYKRQHQCRLNAMPLHHPS